MVDATNHPMRKWRNEQQPPVTLTQLAKHKDVRPVTPSHLSEIERYENEPSLALAAKLSKATGIPLDKFVKQTEAAE